MFCQIDSIDRQLDTIFLFGMFVVYKLTETRNRNIKKRKQETIIITVIRKTVIILRKKERRKTNRQTMIRSLTRAFKMNLLSKKSMSSSKCAS